MATYNGERYIKEQIDSILPQLDECDELIISDDSSTDNTVSVIKDYKDKRINLFINSSTRNPVYNFENALKRASGDMIFLSDQDDIWHPEKVSLVSGFLKSGFSMVITDCELVNIQGKVIAESFFALRKSGPGIIRNLYKNSYLGCCMGFTREVLDKALPFPQNLPMHDMWLGLIAEIYGKTHFTDEKLVKYRRHLNNFTPSPNKSNFTLLKQISIRLKLIYKVYLRRMKII